MKRIDEGSVDLVFADPPFNIGYEYDEYDDRQDDEKYLDWCREWIAEAHRVLSPSGTFWLAIGDEYAAELKVAAQREIGFSTRSWVIWYYTFGVNCTKKFSRSHVHLFHFVKDEKNFTFNVDDPAIRVPSARALVYGDKRANPKGRLPDDTWILRPQDFQSDKYGFTPEQDTWFFSRVSREPLKNAKVSMAVKCPSNYLAGLFVPARMKATWYSTHSPAAAPRLRWQRSSAVNSWASSFRKTTSIIQAID